MIYARCRLDNSDVRVSALIVEGSGFPVTAYKMVPGCPLARHSALKEESWLSSEKKAILP